MRPSSDAERSVRLSSTSIAAVAHLRCPWCRLSSRSERADVNCLRAHVGTPQRMSTFRDLTAMRLKGTQPADAVARSPAACGHRRHKPAPQAAAQPRRLQPHQRHHTEQLRRKYVSRRHRAAHRCARSHSAPTASERSVACGVVPRPSPTCGHRRLRTANSCNSSPKSPHPATTMRNNSRYRSSRNLSLGAAGGGGGAVTSYRRCRSRSHAGLLSPRSIASYRLPPGSILTKRPVPGVAVSLPSCHMRRPLLMVLVTCSHDHQLLLVVRAAGQGTGAVECGGHAAECGTAPSLQNELIQRQQQCVCVPTARHCQRMH